MLSLKHARGLQNVVTSRIDVFTGWTNELEEKRRKEEKRNARSHQFIVFSVVLERKEKRER